MGDSEKNVLTNVRAEDDEEEYPSIWLAPKCESDGHEGRCWCQDNVWDDNCGDPDCNSAPVKYIRADLHEQRIAELERDRQDMAMLIRRLLYRLRKSATIRQQATDYLLRKGLGGSPLRANREAEREVDG